MKELAREYGCVLLETWGEQLEKQAKLFGLEKLPTTLKNFPEIIHSLRF